MQARGQGREVGTTSGILEWQHGDPEAFPRRGPRQSLCQLACCRNPWLHLLRSLAKRGEIATKEVHIRELFPAHLAGRINLKAPLAYQTCTREASAAPAASF
jgi:hypothetical protein